MGAVYVCVLVKGERVSCFIYSYVGLYQCKGIPPCPRSSGGRIHIAEQGPSLIHPPYPISQRHLQFRNFPGRCSKCCFFSVDTTLEPENCYLNVYRRFGFTVYKKNFSLGHISWGLLRDNQEGYYCLLKYFKGKKKPLKFKHNFAKTLVKAKRMKISQS